jgi:signal transduction histidine kinase
MDVSEWRFGLRGLTRRFGEYGIPVVIYTMIMVALIVFVLLPPPLPRWRFYGTLLALAGLLALYMAPFGKDEPSFRAITPLRLTLLLAAGTLALLSNALGIEEGFTFLPYMLFVVVGYAFSVLPSRQALLYSLSVLAIWLALLWQKGSSLGDLLEYSLSIGLGMLFTAIFSLLAANSSEQRARANTLLAELQATNAELKAAREREKEFAVSEERVRLARDIHDGLGHHLTVLNVQLQAAAKLIERDPARAAVAVATSKEVAEAALREVRQSVASMRGTPLDGRTLDEALRDLVETFDRHSPLVARFDQRGLSRPLETAAATTLYRSAQEGLTNAQKHAVAQNALVMLDYTPAAVRLSVRDDGLTDGMVAPNGGGFGLAGLRERTEQLGGAFSAGPQPEGGFLLEVSLPV